MASSREPSALTFIGRPAAPSNKSFIPSLEQPVDTWGCGLCGEGSSFGPNNITWDDNDAMVWDDGDGVSSDD